MTSYQATALAKRKSFDTRGLSFLGWHKAVAENDGQANAFTAMTPGEREGYTGQILEAYWDGVRLGKGELPPPEEKP